VVTAMTSSALDPASRRRSFIVIPATAGVQLHLLSATSWTPTFVGVTNEGTKNAREKTPLDNIPSDMYRFSICSEKEAVSAHY
jgi:hypothetical protein